MGTSNNALTPSRCKHHAVQICIQTLHPNGQIHCICYMVVFMDNRGSVKHIPCSGSLAALLCLWFTLHACSWTSTVRFMLLSSPVRHLSPRVLVLNGLLPPARSEQRGAPGRDRQRHHQLHHRGPGARPQLHLLHRGLHAHGGQPYVRPSQPTHPGGR